MKYIGKIGSVTNTFVHCRDGSVLLLEETGVSGENHRPVAS